MKHALRLAALAAVGMLPLVSFATRSQAQTTAAAQAYELSHSVATNIAGVTGFRAPPAGFDALHATDEQLAAFGLPPRPDPHADATAYAKWAKAMRVPVRRVTGSLRDMHMSSTNGHRAGAFAAGPAGTPSTVSYYNWSGVANTVPGLSAWNPNKSFYYIVSEFNVPAAQQPFGACDGGWDYEVSWNGIDGFNNGDVLQGGSLSGAYCNGGSTSTSYCAWVEWYPSYPILCEYGINPGDDMYVETWNTSSTNGYVYIEDETLSVGSTYNLQPTQPPYLVGNSAEYIVERPCCNNGHDDPLANYVLDFWAASYAYTFAGANSGLPTKQFPGSAATSTYLISMVDDLDSQVISSAITGGRNDITFSDSGCALSGGCTP